MTLRVRLLQQNVDGVAVGQPQSVVTMASRLKGAKGDSAFEVARDAGFAGDVSAWLASLNGEDGAPTEMRLFGGALQWRVAGDPVWQLSRISTYVSELGLIVKESSGLV